MAGMIEHEEHEVGMMNMVKRSSDAGEMKMAQATVTPLHPPGTFSRNTDSGDIINGMATRMGIKPPNNVIRFPKK